MQMEYREWVEKKQKEAKKVYISVSERIGMERGIEQGMKRGIERGMERGIERTALRMLKRGMDISTVSDLADMPEERVRELAEEVFASCSDKTAEEQI